MTEGVVVTGVGMVTPLGVGKAQFEPNLFAGRSGLDRITRFDSSPYGIELAGEVRDFEARRFISPRTLRRMDRLSTYAVASAAMALEDAGFDMDTTDPRRVGVVLGTAFGSTEVATQFGGAMFKDGPRLANPILVPNTVMNAPAGHVAIEIGAQGINATLNHRETSAENALAFAAAQIARGRADMVLAGGVEIISDFFVHVLVRFKALSGLDGRPEAARPFDHERNGPIVGEGAGVLCLESLSHARARGAAPYCEIAGVGMSASPAPPNAWPQDPAGAVMSMHRALMDAGLANHQVDVVSAGANGGVDLDRLEAQALTEVFGGVNAQPWITTLKGACGESFSAGGIRAAALALSLKSQSLPPTMGTRSPVLPLRLVGPKNRPADLKVGLLNTIATGGTFAALVLKRFEEM